MDRWFINRLKTIMAHNDYSENMITTEECAKKDKWTPCDLVLREWKNNGGGSAKGFLGISKNECYRTYCYIKEHKEELITLDYVSPVGYSNSGFTLWSNYNF